MKNSVKIITLVLSLALVLGAAIGFSVSAETTEPTAPVVLKKNVKSNGNFCLMFALDPASCGDTITVEAYNTVTKENATDKDLIESFTVNKADVLNNQQSIDLDGDGNNDEIVMIQTNEGVEAADIADTWHVYFTSNGLTTHVEYSVKDYAFERLYADFTVLENDSTTKAYRQKQFYLSILDIGSTAQNLLVNWDNTTGAPVANPERLAKEYAYASIQGGTFNGGLAGSYVEIDDTLTLTQSADNKEVSWKVYTYDTNGNLVSTETVEITDGSATVTVAGNTVIVPGWAEGLTPGKYFVDIGDSVLSFDNVTAIGDTSLITNTSASTATVGHYSFVDLEGRGKVFNIGKDGVTETGKSRIWIPVVDKANGAGNCLVIETDFYTGGKMVYSTSEAAKSTITSTGMVFTVASTAASSKDTGGWNGANTISNWNVPILDDSGLVTTDNLTGGTYYTINDKCDLEFNTWYNLCIELYDSGKIVVYIDGERVGGWNYTQSSYNTTEFNLPSLAKSVRLDWQERYRPNETYFDNMFVGVISKDYVAE